MSYADYTGRAPDPARDAKEATLRHARAALDTFPRLSNGLTPDTVKADPAWHACHAAVREAFAALRRHNATHHLNERE